MAKISHITYDFETQKKEFTKNRSDIDKIRE
jgi:hypothetical protein